MVKIKNDDYTMGFLTGTIAGAVADSSNFLMTRVLGFGKFGYEDFASVIIFGNIPSTIGQSITAHLVQLFYSSLVGVLFIFWIKKVTHRFLLFKGITFGLFVWFFSFALAQLFKLQFLHQFGLITVIVNIIAAIIYGVILGIILRFINSETFSP